MVDFSASLVHRIFLGKNIDQPVSSSLGPHPTSQRELLDLLAHAFINLLVGFQQHHLICHVWKVATAFPPRFFFGGLLLPFGRVFFLEADVSSFWTEANVATEGLRGIVSLFCGLYFSLNAPWGWHTSVHATGPVALVLENRLPVSNRGLHTHMQIQQKNKQDAYVI